MQIDPKIAMIVKIVLTLANAIGNGTLVLTGLVSVATATTIIAVCQVLVSVLGIIMNAYSSSVPGPLAPQDPDVVVAASAVAALPAGSSPAQVGIVKAAAKAAVDHHQP